MTGPLRSLSSSLSSKFIVALTGAALLLFVIGHTVGNLQVFLGPEALNSYAAKLQSLGGLLWAVRLGLLSIALLHVILAVRAALISNSARPVAYEASGNVQKTVSARSMIWTGLLILAFVVYHLAHFTWGWIRGDDHALVDAAGRPDVYSMVVLSFQQLPIALSYIVAMVLLGFHLMHGGWSLFQTLGFNHPAYEPAIKTIATIVAWILLIANVSMPLAVLLGGVTLPPGVGS